MLTWEHGNSFLNKDIIYVFNEFDIFEDESGKKLIEYINDKVSSYTSCRFFNVTDGLRNVFQEHKLTRQAFRKRVNDIFNTKNPVEKDYFQKFEELKSKDGIEISKNILFTEATLPEICNRKITNDIKENCIFTLNNFDTDIKRSELIEKISGTIKNKIVVIVDTVIPRFFSPILIDNALSIQYIGSYENYLHNIEIIKEYECNIKLEKIENYSLLDYFKEFVDYIDAFITNEKLGKSISSGDITENYRSFKEVLNCNGEKFTNLINNYDSRVINLKVFPYIIVYINNYPDKYLQLINMIFKNFSEKYVQDFFKSLIQWDKILTECKTTCIISMIMWKELKLNSIESIDEFFDYIYGTSSYEFFDVHNRHFINEILQESNSELKEYLITKFIEYLIKKEKFTVFDTISKNICSYIETVAKYCKIVLNDLNESICIYSLPEALQDVLANFKDSYEGKNNIEWVHEDGINSNNSTIAPFSLSFNKKLLYKDKITKFKNIRPFICKSVAFIIEENKANVIDLFTLEQNNYIFNGEEHKFKFLTYNSNLISSLSGNLYYIDKNCVTTDLNAKFDPTVYNGIRIKENYVYYFTDKSTLIRVDLESFIKGEALFSEEVFIIQNSEDNQEIIDVLIIKDNILWITDKFLWHFDLLSGEIKNKIVLFSIPSKLFLYDDKIYILFKNSLWIYEEFSLIKWITDLVKWQSFTCYAGNLILAKGKNLYCIELNKSNLQVLENEIIKSDITDIIATSNRLLVVDNNGNIYDVNIKSEGIKNIQIKVNNLIETNGQKGKIIYSQRHMAINNSDYFYIYSA